MENLRLEDWLSQVCESPKTRGLYLMLWDHFTKFCQGRGKDSASLVDDWRSAKRLGESPKDAFLEEWQDVIRAFNTWVKPKYAPLTIKNHLSTLKSFLRYWDIPLKVDLPKHCYVLYHNRDIKKEELKKILTFSSPRDRVIWLVMAESGMRSSNAANLKYFQIKEDFEAERIPMKISLPSATLKDHVGDRFTFIGYEGFRELANYLHGKKLGPNDYVFASEKQGLCKGEQFTPASLSVKYNRLVQKLGIDKSRGNKQEVGRPKMKEIRLHGLRKYFRNNQGADSSFIEFWLGHSLGVDNHYISRDIEQHRKKYAEGYESLRVSETGGTDLRSQLAERDSEIQELKEKIKGLQDKFGSVDQKIESTIIRELRKFGLVTTIGKDRKPIPHER
ncbi:site-specific integrase [Candidatus Bathyarchaeota archaeon]|nr:site-specific integrase [Candidatus Bathyarchaeota archaeon]